MTTPSLDRLRAEIGRLEGRSTSFLTPAASPSCAAPPARDAVWTFGVPAIDRLLTGGLSLSGLHEINPQRYGDSWSALAFALALLSRRTQVDRTAFAWCFTPRQASEFGHPAAEGLLRFGIDPARFILIDAANAAELGFVLEEGLRCGRLAAVLAPVGRIDATMTRRLSLAAREGETPALLLTEPGSPGVATAASRWRIALPPRPRQPTGTPVCHDELVWRAELLRNRHGPTGQPLQLAFSLADPDCETRHEQAFRLHPSAASADRTSAAA